MPHQALARSLGESKVKFNVEDAWPFRERASGPNGRLNPLRMDITTEAGALFDNQPRRINKISLLDITIVNPCASSYLDNAARHAGHHFGDAVERKKNKYRGSFSANNSFLSHAMSTCGEVGSDVHALIKELAIRWGGHRLEKRSNEPQHLAQETEVARLRRRFSFVLQQALLSSLQTGDSASGHPAAPFTRSGACTRPSYRGGNRVQGTGRSEPGRGRDRSQ